jgi:glycosyl transferase, family 25
MSISIALESSFVGFVDAPKAPPTLIDHFSATRVINLTSRHDRRQETLDEFTRHGLRFARQVEFFQASRPATTEGFPTLGCRGCFQSHLRLLRWFADSELDSLLVLEDDIRFFDVRSPVLDTLRETPWDIAYFGRCDMKSPKGPQRLQRLAPTSGVQGLHCYAIKRDVAGRLADYLEACLQREPGHPEGGPMHVDGAFSMFRARNPDVVTLLATPFLAGFRRSSTDIHDTKIKRIESLPGMHALLSSVRKLRNELTRMTRTAT